MPEDGVIVPRLALTLSASFSRAERHERWQRLMLQLPVPEFLGDLLREGRRKEQERTCTSLVLHSILVLEACWDYVPQKEQQYAGKRLRELAQQIPEKSKGREESW